MNIQRVTAITRAKCDENDFECTLEFNKPSAIPGFWAELLLLTITIFRKIAQKFDYFLCHLISHIAMGLPSSPPSWRRRIWGWPKGKEKIKCCFRHRKWSERFFLKIDRKPPIWWVADGLLKHNTELNSTRVKL